MANNYTEGTGALVYDGKPKLSAVSAILMDHVHQYENKDGFYLEEGAYVSPEDLMESLIDYALGLIKDDASCKTLKRRLEKAKDECLESKHKAFMKLPILLREAGVPVNGMLESAIQNEASHPIEYVMAVVDDPDGNLVSVSYEECYRCEKLRPGEFGGVGYYHSRNVDYVGSSYQVVSYGADLDKAIIDRDLPAITALVSQRLVKVVDAILDPDIRYQVAKRLLAVEALHTVEDGVVSQVDGDDKEPGNIPDNLGIKLFNEILANVETVAEIGEQFGSAALVDLIYLLQVLAKHKPGGKGFIEQTFDSRIVDFLKTLPNRDVYLKFVSTEMCDNAKSAGGAS